MNVVEGVSARLLAKAVNDATSAVEKGTILTGKVAREAATAALTGGGDALRSEYALRLANPREAVINAGVAVALLAVDTVLLATVAVKGGTTTRVVAGVCLAGHVALVVFSRRRQANLVAARDAAYARPEATR